MTRPGSAPSAEAAQSVSIPLTLSVPWGAVRVDAVLVSPLNSEAVAGIPSPLCRTLLDLMQAHPVLGCEVLLLSKRPKLPAAPAAAFLRFLAETHRAPAPAVAEAPPAPEAANDRAAEDPVERLLLECGATPLPVERVRRAGGARR